MFSSVDHRLLLGTAALLLSLTVYMLLDPKPLLKSFFGARRLFTNNWPTAMAVSSSAAITDDRGLQLNYSVAYVTVPNDDVAKKIARGLVQNKLAACVNIIPNLLSVYEWEGKINEDSELLLMIKTRTSHLPDLTTFVKENHPYDVCEVISTSIEHGNQPYLDWIGSSVPEK